MIDAPADLRRSPVRRLLGQADASARATATEDTPLLVDLSLLPRIGFKGRGTIEAMQRRGIAVEPTPNRVFRQPDSGLCLVLAPGEVLLLPGLDGDGERLDGLAQDWRIEDAERTYPLPRRDSHAWFALAGAAIPEALATLCGVDLRPHKFPDGAIAQTSLARLNAILARADAGGRPLYHLLADSASGEYLWECLRVALDGIGGQVADIAALRTIP